MYVVRLLAPETVALLIPCCVSVECLRVERQPNMFSTAVASMSDLEGSMLFFCFPFLSSCHAERLSGLGDSPSICPQPQDPQWTSDCLPAIGGKVGEGETDAAHYEPSRAEAVHR